VTEDHFWDHPEDNKVQTFVGGTPSMFAPVNSGNSKNIVYVIYSLGRFSFAWTDMLLHCSVCKTVHMVFFPIVYVKLLIWCFVNIILF